MTPKLPIQICFLLLLTTFATALPPTKRAGTSIIKPASTVKWSVVSSGQYSIANCGGNTSTITQLLDHLYLALQPAIQDATASPLRPSRAFNAFFHSPLTASTHVADLLTNITTGVSLYTLDPGLTLGPPASEPNRSPLSSGSPTFVCAAEPGKVINRDDNSDLFDYCHDNPNTVMDYFGGNQFMLVCPQFFTIGLRPMPPRSNCLGKNPITGGFRGTGARLSHFQIWVVLDQIVHYYINAGRHETRDVSDVNECVGLTTRKAMENSMSYVYYVAILHGHCTTFPDLSDAALRRLLLSNNLTAPDAEDPNGGRFDVADLSE